MQGKEREKEGYVCVKQHKKRKEIYVFFAMWSGNSTCKNEAGEV